MGLFEHYDAKSLTTNRFLPQLILLPYLSAVGNVWLSARHVQVRT